jgi:hypothetical protein
MATLVVTPSEASLGKPVVLTGASWGTDPVTITVISPNEESGLKVTLTPVTNAITSVGVFVYTPGKEGLYTFKATDGASSVSATLKVNKGGA